MPLTDTPPRAPLLIVTGLSGAGKSSALNVLEDLDFEAIDNLPLSLLPQLLQDSATHTRPLAVGVDIRTRDFNPDSLLTAIKPHAGKILFLDCTDDELLNRFSATRRRHPLAGDQSAAHGIEEERALLIHLKQAADTIIDTSRLRLADLSHLLAADFDPERKKQPVYTVLSFSYARGLPQQADFIFDTRFLNNPYYEPQLRDLSGRSQKVQDYVAADSDFAPYLEAIKTLLTPLLPRFKSEGKNYVTLAFGCTGGQHRSVTTAIKIAQWLEAQVKTVNVVHRDVR